jgi:hypothetical protein
MTGRLAQLVEQLTLNQRVTGSSPVSPIHEVRVLLGLRDVSTSVLRGLFCALFPVLLQEQMVSFCRRV